MKNTISGLLTFIMLISLCIGGSPAYAAGTKVNDTSIADDEGSVDSAWKELESLSGVILYGHKETDRHGNPYRNAGGGFIPLAGHTPDESIMKNLLIWMKKYDLHSGM